MFSPSRLMLAAASWLRTRRSRCIFLLLCSPLLLPFVFATFPLLCAVQICIRLCRRFRSGRTKDGDGSHESQEEERLRRCEEGCYCDGAGGEEGEVGLLQRYLEDQILLVGSVYECGDECDDDRGRDRDHDRGEGGQSQDCIRIPLLR